MGELGEPKWAVVSERGREAAGITYAEAYRFVRGLAGEKLSGLCIITDEAAQRIPDRQNSDGDASKSAVITRRK